MARSCFLSYSKTDKEICATLASKLDSAGIKVYRYDPDNLWEDAVERMATAIAKEAGCLVSLRLGKPLGKFCQLEVDWAKKCALPIIYVDNTLSMRHVVEQVKSAKATSLPWAFSHDQWKETVAHFRDAAAELAGLSDLQRDDNYGSVIDSDLNAAAKYDDKYQRAALAIFCFWVGSIVCIVAIFCAALALILNELFWIGAGISLIASVVLLIIGGVFWKYFVDEVGASRRRPE